MTAARPAQPTFATGDRVLVTATTDPDLMRYNEEFGEPFEAVLLAINPDQPHNQYRVRTDDGRESDVFAVRATGLVWAQYETAQARHETAAAWALLDQARAERNRFYTEIQDIVAFMSGVKVSDDVRLGLRRIVERRP